MQLNHLAGAVVFVSMLAFVSYAETTTAQLVLSGVATTSGALVDMSAPGAVFLDWNTKDKENIFDLSMPWGVNGVRAELLENAVVVATSTLNVRTPFAQRVSFTRDVPDDGYYVYQVNLCSGVATSTGCTLSPEVALVVRSGKVLLESSLSPDEQTVERARELAEQEDLRVASYMEAEGARMRGLVPESSGLESLQAHAESNIERIRRLVMNDAQRMLFAPSNYISRSAFFEAVQKFPAFCNESDGSETLDAACARELSAIIAYATYYTSKSNTNIRSGMMYPAGIISLLGNDVRRFERMFPSKEGDFALRIKAHPDDALLALLWWYMTPQSPEPDPHSALLGIWQPNSIDSARGLHPGFGATINIATHGKSCAGGDAAEVGPILRTHYTDFLKGFGMKDDHHDLCALQYPFSIGGSAFLPQYWEQKEDGSACVLGFKENIFFTQDTSSRVRCTTATIGATGTTPVVSASDYRKAALMQRTLIERIGTGDGLYAKARADIDPRVQLGAAIVGSYPYWRAYASGTQPEQIPFARINTLFVEGAYPGDGGALQYRDAALLNDYFFTGDCFREECARGLSHQLELAHLRYPKVQLILSVGGWDGSSNFTKMSDDKFRKKFIESIRDELSAHAYWGGVDINWMYPSSATSSDFTNGGGDKETMRHILIDLRNMENALYENDGISRKLYLGVGATEDASNGVGLGDVAPFVDAVHLITYDLHGPWEKQTGHGAQLFATNIAGDSLSVANAVTIVRKAGVPAKKIIIGIPYYGRMWSAVPLGSNKLLPGFGIATNATSTATLIDYRTIVRNVLGKGEYQYYEDVLRGAAYLYDGDRFVSYDPPEIIEKKMQYVWNDGFGGVLLADIMGDDGILQDRVLSVLAAQAEKKSCKLSRKPDRNLASNSRGADVFALQTFLACLGDIPEHIDINGNYGVATEEGVKIFQKAEGLEITGVVGKETRDRLSKY
jgi:chitinase